MLLSLSLLSGCASLTGSGEIDFWRSADRAKLDAKAKQTLSQVCSGSWRPVGWSKKDTDDTIREVKANNAAWKAWCGK